MKNILITVPDLNKAGGVSSLYNILKFDQVDRVSYFNVHGKNTRTGLRRFMQILKGYISFASEIDNVGVTQINPSLDKKSFLRDGIFSFISKSIKHKQTVVYWHGWKEPFEKSIHENRLKKFFFKHTFGKADMHIVLGSIFEQKLEHLGISRLKIRKESNAADDSFLVPGFQKILPEKNSLINILYLARVEEAKGIYVAIDTIKKIGTKANVKLIVAGNGSEEERAKKYANEAGVNNIDFLGYVDGHTKNDVLQKAHILFLPSYSEGMPISILEGMLYGLSIISRPIGGISDWVIDGENGYLVKSLDAKDFCEKILTMINDIELMQTISGNNSRKAISHFTPVAVRQRLLNYYDTLIENKSN